MISGIGANKNARRTALVHLYFNVVGTTVFLIAFYTLNYFLKFGFMDGAATAAGIAAVHTTFNVTATLVLLPFSKGLVKLACLTIPETEEEQETASEYETDFQLLDQRFLETPGYATEQCHIVAAKMAALTKKSVVNALNVLEK